MSQLSQNFENQKLSEDFITIVTTINNSKFTCGAVILCSTTHIWIPDPLWPESDLPFFKQYQRELCELLNQK